MQNVEFGAGTHIDHAAKMLVAAAVQHGSAKGKFNDIELTADSKTRPEEILKYWEKVSAANADSYRNSEACKNAARDAEDRRLTMQKAAQSASAQLSNLDWLSDVAVLDWLCTLQPASDHVGVKVDRAMIVSEFERHGFHAGANCGDQYKEDDRENSFRYLVGQALSGLKDGPSIHPILLKFASDWKKKFAVTAA